MRKMLSIAVIACTAVAAALFVSGTAGADTTDRAVPAGEAGVLASPRCSGTAGHGKILYQVCVRYNCDSTGCYHRGYLGVINTATSSRTVTWDLDWSRLDLPYWVDDDSGSVTLAAGQQQTILSTTTVKTTPCDFTGQRRLRVSYDSTGFSPFIQVSEFMACV